MLMNTLFAIPEQISGNELKEYRRFLGLTQQQLGDFAQVSKKTVERWESPQSVVRGPVVTLLRLLFDEPEKVQYYSIPERKYRLRLWYMYKDRACTLIDVDERTRRVEIRNYTKHMQFRAFGVNEQPTYTEYEEFLKTRCFPETRDKMKLILEDLDLPFYDPLLIIEKTQGRMAEDDFWIRIEK